MENKKQEKGNMKQILVMLIFFAVCFGIGFIVCESKARIFGFLSACNGHHPHRT